MRRVIAFVSGFVLLCVVCGCGDKRPQTQEAPDTAQSRIERHISALTGEDMAGRRGGSRGEARAALYLAKQLQQAGLEPAGEAGTYLQSFPIGEYDAFPQENRMVLRQTATNSGMSENVLGMLPGVEDRIIIVSAHYDHLGVINEEVYPGANDNASGTALVLELASALSREMPKNRILFAFWGAEEMGLLGSTYFNAHPTVSLEKVLCVINIDSVGNLRTDKKLLGWSNTHNDSVKYILEVLSGEGWQIDWQYTEKHSSDHAPFAGAGISAFTLLSPGWLEGNHTPQDTAQRLQTGLLTDLMLAIRKALAS